MLISAQRRDPLPRQRQGYLQPAVHWQRQRVLRFLPASQGQEAH